MPQLYMLLIREQRDAPWVALAPPTRLGEPWLFSMSEALEQVRTYALQAGVENVRIVMDVKLATVLTVIEDKREEGETQ